jgi:hypothetical protein
MRSVFYFLVARLLPTNSVDRAVKALVKAASALAAAEEVQNSRVTSINDQIANLRDERVLALATAQRAARIRERLAELTA